MSVRLFIAGMEAELADTTEVAITKQAANVLQLDKRQLDFSNRITLPPTTTNIKLMQNLGVNGNNSERPYKYASARLEIDGITYADNLVSIVDDLGGNGYEVRLLGNPFDAFQQMKGKQIRDVVDSFVNGGIHSLNIASWKAFQNASGGLTYPLISQARPFPVFPKTRLYIDLTYPAFFTRDLLQKMLEQYFTNITGNALLSDLYSRDLTFAADTESILWKEWERAEASRDVLLNIAGSGTTLTAFTLTLNKNEKGAIANQFVVSQPFFYYRAPANRSLKIKGRYSIQGNLGSGVRIELRTKPSSQTDINIFDPVISQTDYFTSSINANFEFDYFIRGDNDLYFLIRSTGTFNFDIEQFEVEFEVLRQGIFGDETMNPKLLIADCTEYEYFIDQIKRFGIIFQTYFDGSIRMESFKDVFSGAFGAQDWTNKIVDVTKTSYELGQYGKNSYIQYKGDRNGELLGGYNGWGFWIYDNDRYDIEKIAVESKGKAVSQLLAHLQPPFENALNVGGFELNNSTDVILTQEKELVYGRLNQNDEFANDYQLWLLNDGAFTGNTGQVLQPFEFVANVSLAELGSHITDYYGNLINSLERPVVREVEVYLSEVDFYNLDFFKLIYLEQFQKYHYLLSVENYIPGKTCKAKLLEVKGQLSVSKCCDYSVEGIDLIANCFTVTFPEDLAFNEPSGGFADFSVQANQFAFPNYPTLVNLVDGVTVSFTPSIQELLDALEANFNSQIFWNQSNPDVFTFERLPLGFKICYTGEDFLSGITLDLQGSHNQGLNPYILDFNGQVYIIDNQNDFSKTIQFGLNVPDNTFQVLINSEWVDVTDEVVDGTWQRLNVCDDVITEWRIIDSEENVINSGNVTANCTF